MKSQSGADRQERHLVSELCEGTGTHVKMISFLSMVFLSKGKGGADNTHLSQLTIFIWGNGRKEYFRTMWAFWKLTLTSLKFLITNKQTNPRLFMAHKDLSKR